MSYTLIIGEAILESNINRHDEEIYCKWDAKMVELPEAPSFEGDDLSNHNNTRSPGYSQWSTFCKETGLTDIFFNEENGLIREHPGCFFLNKHHLFKFKEALLQLEEKDKRPAGLDPRYIGNDLANVPVGQETTCYNKVRLIWLIWWTEWALNNCVNPVISNS